LGYVYFDYEVNEILHGPIGFIIGVAHVFWVTVTQVIPGGWRHGGGNLVSMWMLAVAAAFFDPDKLFARISGTTF
jgi:hypothetical protein